MPNSELRPEDQLVIVAARRDLNEVTAQRIRVLVKSHNLDWERVLAKATLQGLSPLLAHQLSATAEVVPPSILSRLKAENQENSQRSLWMAGELAKIATAMETAGIPCISFKGPTLAITVYGDLGLRPFTDLDLFVHARDLDHASKVLLKHGFAQVRTLSRGREAALLRFDNACAFVNQQDLLIDLHWRFAPRHFVFRLETGGLWQRLKSVNIGNQRVFTLSAEDLLLVLCCHGFTHEWEKLVWVCDIATLIGRHDLDWDCLFAQARQLGIFRIVALGLVLAGELGATLPSQILDRIKGHGANSFLAQQFMAQVFTSDNRHPGSLGIKDQLRMRERSRDKIRALFGIVLTPRDYDWMFASVPDSLSFLYYLIRPIRMATAFGLTLLRRSGPTSEKG